MTHLIIERNQRINPILLYSTNNNNNYNNNDKNEDNDNNFIQFCSIAFIHRIVLQIHSISSSFPTSNLRIIPSKNNNNNWNKLYHTNYTFFCYYFGKLSKCNICPKDYFSYYLFLYFLLLFFYFNIKLYFFRNNANNKTDQNNIEILHKLETYLNIIVNDENIGLKNKINMRLWHDEGSRKKISTE